MGDTTVNLDELMQFAQSKGRVCPMPNFWNDMYEMLPNKVRIGAGWNPPLPLILGAWWHTSDLQKTLRFQEHLSYAEASGILANVDSYLRALPENAWHHKED